MNKYLLIVLVIMSVAGCNIKPNPPEEVQKQYSALKISPAPDTLFMQFNGEKKTLALSGSYINESQRTIKNSGFIIDAEYTVRTIDTVFETVDASKAIWHSSNSSVVSAANGVLTSGAAGVASITAQINSAMTAPLIVSVHSVDTAPGLSLDPPEA